MKGEKTAGRICRLRRPMLGVCFLAGADWQLSSRALFGDFLALMGAVAMPPFCRKTPRTITTETFMCLTALFAGGLLMLIALFENPNALSAIEHQDWLWIGALAILPHLVGHGLLTYCLRNSSPSEVALAEWESRWLCFTRVSSLLETVSLFAGIGCMITLAVSVRKRPRKAKPPRFCFIGNPMTLANTLLGSNRQLFYLTVFGPLLNKPVQMRQRRTRTDLSQRTASTAPDSDKLVLE